MLKILIADDEAPMRQWFTFCIEKSSNEDYSLVGQASNGEEALELFKEHNPDVVITDISMPVMDGIELLKQIKTISPSTEVVLLTCYADFEYARQAVKQGAFEYLLKTETTAEDVYVILEKISIKQQNKVLYDDAFEYRRQNELDEIITEILDENSNIEEEIINDRFNSFCIDPDKDNLACIAVRFDNQLKRKELKEKIRLNGSDYWNKLFMINYKKDMLFILGNLKGNPSQLLLMTNLYSFSSKIFKGCECSAGIGSIFQEKNCLGRSIRESFMLLRYEFYKGRNSITFSTELRSNEDSIHLSKPYIKAFYEAVEKKDIRAIYNTLADTLDFFEKGQFDNIDYILQVSTEMLEFLYHTFYSKEPGFFAYKNSSKIVGECRYYSQLKDAMTREVLEIEETVLEDKVEYPAAIAKALEYIERNYSQHISLKDVSEYVHLNPNYFCRLFRTTTGENFSVYLMIYRLKKADELLRQSGLKVSEVAEKVGYPNVSYFSRIFKKYTGKNPLDSKKS